MNVFYNSGIKKVSRHTLRAGKSAVYAASRLSVYYSNSRLTVRNINEYH
ncbi:hypothetical protein BRYFOR_09002 [Marvinbryantia formatexigens DSM 14469]|uniref:Uncharacterized protein n=1 Tax=Marvinbryantia formatexigens DSM 14469 TaxID=478749 RepID=C6LK15_9FIRM|nr:hypothetical protein BRYFOR_09002 [Marvinbryantia formatexigens DSM 14469]